MVQMVRGRGEGLGEMMSEVGDVGQCLRMISWDAVEDKREEV